MRMTQDELQERIRAVTEALVGVNYLDWRMLRDEIDGCYEKNKNLSTLSRDQAEQVTKETRRWY